MTGYLICDCGHDQRQHDNHRSLSPFMHRPCAVKDCDCTDFRPVNGGGEAPGGEAA